MVLLTSRVDGDLSLVPVSYAFFLLMVRGSPVLGAYKPSFIYRRWNFYLKAA